MTKKPASKLRALLDDDPPAPPVIAPKKSLRDLLGDDDAPAKPAPMMPAHSFAVCGFGTDMPGEKKVAPIKPKKEAPPPPPKVATPLDYAAIVHSGESPVLIICALDSQWQEMMCWNIPLMTTMHLRRNTLEPVAAVDAVIAALQKHIKILPSKR